jgi:ribose transport system substrate-binding protein
MKCISRSKALASIMMVATSALAMSSVASHAQTPSTCVTGVDMATLAPKSIIGQGPNGEKAASVDEVQLTSDEAAKVKAGKFKVGITMQTVNLDWSQLQVQGVTDTLKKYDVEVIGVTSAEYQVDKQIANIEDTIQRHPDGIISIPVDGTATAATYKKVSAAGITRINMPPWSPPTAKEMARSPRKFSLHAWRRAPQSVWSISASTISAPTNAPRACANGWRRIGLISK